MIQEGDPGPGSTRGRATDAFVEAWAERWGELDPRFGAGGPSDALSDHRAAYPDFRDPLAVDDWTRAGAEFYRDVVARLAAGRPISLLTFDYENEDRDERTYTESSLHVLLARELAWSVVLPPEECFEGETSTVHVFVSQVAGDDPCLDQVWTEIADTGECVTVAGWTVDWVARPHGGGCVAVHAFDAGLFEILHLAQRGAWARWGIQHDRQPLVDLAEVAAYIDRHREAWEADGARITTGPQYRIWPDGEENFPSVVCTQHDDLSAVDWLLVDLETNTATLHFIAHDSGACDVWLDLDVHDEDSEAIVQRRGRAGSLDVDGIVAALERAVRSLLDRT